LNFALIEVISSLHIEGSQNNALAISQNPKEEPNIRAHLNCKLSTLIIRLEPGFLAPLQQCSSAVLAHCTTGPGGAGGLLKRSSRMGPNSSL